MTQDQIKNVAEENGWRVYFSEQDNTYCNGQSVVVEFSSYTTYGQNVVVSVVAQSLEDVPERVQDYYEGFDVDEETALWIGEDGHGKKGAPYHISAIVKDMEEAERMIEDLAIALNQIV